MIAAGSGDEDYVTWLLFELEGAEWYAVALTLRVGAFSIASTRRMAG